jgi:TolB-like protein
MAGLLTAAEARAERRRLAIVRLEFQGLIPEAGRVFLSQRLIEALAAAEFQVFAGPVVEQLVKQGSGLEDCREEACYREIARRLGVEYLVTGRIQVDKKNYEVILHLLDGGEGKDVGQSRERCDLCGIKEVGRKMEAQILALRRHATAAAASASAPARFSIESRPAGAVVSIEGKVAGVTPMALELPAGSHKMTLAAAGYRPSEHRFQVESGTKGYVSVDLTPERKAPDPEPTPPPPRPRPWRLLGWSAILTGALAAVAGGVVLSFDGSRVRCLEHDAVGLCSRELERQTRLEAGVLFGAGAALLSAGGTMVYVGWHERASGRAAGEPARAAEPAAGAGHSARAISIGVRGFF